jgi:hypothetical protein
MTQSNPNPPPAQATITAALNALEYIRYGHNCLLGMPPCDRVTQAMDNLQMAALLLHNEIVPSLRGAA